MRFRILLVIGAVFAGALIALCATAAGSCQMSGRAANLVKVLDKATANMLDAEGNTDVPGKGGRSSVLDPQTGMPTSWSPHCSQYFRAVMRELTSSGTKGSEQQKWTNENANADELISEIKRSVDWVPVADRASVQGLANQGIVVVGTVRDHLGFAFPLPPSLDVSFFNGEGPFVRDGNEHPVDAQARGRLFPSTWGAVKTSKAFGRPESVQWFQFKATIPSSWDGVKEWATAWLSTPVAAACSPINPPKPAELDESGCAYQSALACQRQCDARWPNNALRALECAARCKPAYGCCLDSRQNYNGKTCF